MKALDQLRLIFEKQINVMSIAEKLLVFSEENYLSEMEARNFQTAVIASGKELLKFDLSDNQLTPIPENELIASDTPLMTVFYLLLENRRYFIAQKGKISHIVTRSDLDKIPLRLAIFGLISIFETYLKKTVRAQIPNWPKDLSKERIAAAEKLFQLKKSRQEEIDLVQCLQFVDLGSVFAKKKRYKKFVPSITRDGYDDNMRNIGKLRDAITHSQHVLPFSWEEIAELIGFIRNLMDREASFKE